MPCGVLMFLISQDVNILYENLLLPLVRFESTQTQEGVNCVDKFSQFLGTGLGLVWTDYL